LRRDGEDLFARRVIMPVAARPVPTGERGSYTVETVTGGVTPTCRSRFVRTDLVSVLVS